MQRHDNIENNDTMHDEELESRIRREVIIVDDILNDEEEGFDDEEHEAGVRCIAVAIRNWAGEPVAAVSISAPAARLNESMMQKMLPQLGLQFRPSFKKLHNPFDLFIFK